MYKDFDDFWKNSGILETDSYRCIAETYEFNKENIPQAFQSFGRNCYTYGLVEGYDSGVRQGRKETTKSFLELLEMIKIADNINSVHEIVDIIKKNMEH